MKPKALKWTPKLVGRFWDAVAESSLAELSFSRLGGRSFLIAMDHLLPRDGEILDFGAGDGDLIRLMSERGLPAWAYEISEGRIENLRKKLAGCKGFGGVVTDASEKAFDVVLLIEVIEHILDEQLESSLKRLADFTKPGGLLIVTTPNNENLEYGMCIFPGTNKIFHRWQHMRSFTRETLCGLLEKYGFEEIVTHYVGFNDTENAVVPGDEIWGTDDPRPPMPDYIEKIRRNEQAMGGSQSNLLYVGRKRELHVMVRRRLRAAKRRPFIGPVVRTARAAVHLVFWLFSGNAAQTGNFSKRIRQALSGLARLAPSPVRWLLRLPRRLARKVRPFLYRGAKVFWTRIGRYRPLLAAERRELSLWQRAQRRVLAGFLALPDPYYRRALAKFEGHLDTEARQTSSRAKGVHFMIGSLGPGGAERQVALTLVGLAKRNYRPVGLSCLQLQTDWTRMFVPLLEAESVAADEISSHSVELLPDSLRAALATLPYGLHNVAQYAAAIAAHRPAVAHLWLDDVNIKGGIAAVALGVPKVLLFMRSFPPNNFVFDRPYLREAYRWLIRQPGVMPFSNSRAGAMAYEKWLGLPRDSIEVIHNGFEFDREKRVRYQAGRGAYRDKMGIPRSVPVVGVVFRMSEEKRPLLFLEIAAKILKKIPEAHFLIVGDGVLREEVEARAREADLKDAVHFAGYENDALSAIVDMDIFLLTSRIEGLPNVLIEAQAMGVPVVTTPAGGARETVDHGRTGIVLEDSNSGKAAEVIVNLLRDEVWMADARQAAPEFVERAFCIEKAVDNILMLYGVRENRDGNAAGRHDFVQAP